MEKRQLASAFYGQGVDAKERQDRARTIDLFEPCIRLIPGHVMYHPLTGKCSGGCVGRL